MYPVDSAIQRLNNRGLQAPLSPAMNGVKT